MRSILIFSLLLLGCAHAEPAKAKAPTVEKAKAPPAPKLPQYVDGADAVAALAASSDLQIAKLKWDQAKLALRLKYGVDVDHGDGWDPQPDGRLKVRIVPVLPPVEVK